MWVGKGLYLVLRNFSTSKGACPYKNFTSLVMMTEKIITAVSLKDQVKEIIMLG